ncbi:MAG: phosphoribosylglycinamide formyltransferase [Actinomycetota bacterium]
MSTLIGILASGAGTTAQALIDASSANRLGGGKVIVLVSDQSEAGALQIARDGGVEALFVDPASYQSRSDYCEAVASELKSRDVQVVCSAGFMKILSPGFVKAFEGNILNNHPSLLPSFPGAHSVADALAWGVKVTGATIHLIDEETDHGPIISQFPVHIEPGDDEASLHERIKVIERVIYPQAVSAFCSGRVKVEGRLVTVEPNEGNKA